MTNRGSGSELALQILHFEGGRLYMPPRWFSKRGYKHLDAPVGEAFAQRIDKEPGIRRHAWSPLIFYVKRTKRYKPLDGVTVYKDRPIMYASHRDACILSKYASSLTDSLDIHYERERITENVIGYRRLGKSNYDFSADAYRFARANSPCVVLCFDITGFFDHLDHQILKDRLKRVLGVKELPSDWYQVFRHVTRFSYVDRKALAEHPTFGPRLRSRALAPAATIAELKSKGVAIERNPEKFGIPQGTPISSVFSNLYMVDLDQAVATFCAARGALYRRYSDDILIVCSVEDETAIHNALLDAVAAHKLQIKSEKTERALFGSANSQVFQYLGFHVSRTGATIRPSSLARQWRKIKRSILKTKKIGEAAIAHGKTTGVYTKRLRQRFSPIGVRNFSSYARRAANAFGSKKDSAASFACGEESRRSYPRTKDDKTKVTG